MIPCEGLPTIRIPTDQRKYQKMDLVVFTVHGRGSEVQRDVWEGAGQGMTTDGEPSVL